jgi:hypothetical protein
MIFLRERLFLSHVFSFDHAVHVLGTARFTRIVDDQKVIILSVLDNEPPELVGVHVAQVVLDEKTVYTLRVVFAEKD